MAMTLITTNTSSDAATSDFTTGIDSTYKLYIFKYFDVNPATDQVDFTFQANAAGASGYNETMTTTAFQALHTEADDAASLGYNTGEDQAQGTAYQVLAGLVGNGGDESAAGTLWLFNPSNTTYVKHFYATTNFYRYVDRTNNSFFAGYINTTTAIDDIQFKMSSGNMDAVIKMYGVG
jgi:hypothetical protein